MVLPDRITSWLQRTNNFRFSLYAAGIAFYLYTCVYTLRKTFSVATFDGIFFIGISYKVWLITFQVLGYALSKFIGIKIIAELKEDSRAIGIFVMSFIAAISWLFFALVPAPYNMIFLFTNGLPLGMIWGMVFSYLEGRRCTEVLGAGLSISFIFSSGFAKTVGAYIMLGWNTSEQWMPFVTSCIFFVPLLCFIWLIDRIPPPSDLDKKMRTKRQPMNGIERKKFIYTFLPGLVFLILAYMLLTALRDFRDNFSAEIWAKLGYGHNPKIFTATEIPISLGVLCTMGSIMLIKNNMKALVINHFIIISGLVLIGVTTILFERQLISPPVWMTLVGLGLYIGYVPFNSILFDRLIASFQYVGTVGFIMYLADSFGYLGSVGVLLFKEFGQKDLSWLEFFMVSGYFISITGSILILGSMIYFLNKQRGWSKKEIILKRDVVTT